MVSLGLTVAGILLTHVRVQQAADAAAEAGLLALKQPLFEAMEVRANSNLSAYWQWVEDEVEREMAEDLDGKGNPRHPASYYRRRVVRRSKPEIAEQLLSGMPLPWDVKVHHFLSAAETGCLVKRVGEVNQERMAQWAGELSTANGADSPAYVQFTAEGDVQITVLVPHRLRLLALDRYLDENHRYLLGEGVQTLRSVAGIPIEVPRACP